MNLLGQGQELAVHLLGHLLQQWDIEADAGLLHLFEDRDQRDLDALEEVPGCRLCELRRQQISQAPGDIGILAGIAGHILDRHLTHRALAPARADEVGDGDFLDLQMLQGEGIQIVLAPGGIHHIGGHHGVEVHALQLNAMTAENQHVVLDILTTFEDRRVLQDWLQTASST